MIKQHLFISSFRYISCLLSVCVLIFVFKYVSNIVERKDCINEYAPFFEKETDYDILFFGSSHMAGGVSPLELWNDYGITAYNFGNATEAIPITYWTIKMAIEQKCPKIIVLDIFMCFADDDRTSEKIQERRQAWDCFPLTGTKIRAVFDVIDDNNAKGEYLFSVGKFHSRWNEITSDDFVLNPSKSNGLWAYGSGEEKAVYSQVEPWVQREIEYEKIALDENTLDMKYLRKIIELCQCRGIDIVLTNIPYVCAAEAQMQKNYLKDLADEYNINYINFVQMNNVIDFGTDMMGGTHMNPSGMMKITDYMGDYLIRKYQLEDHRNDEKYKWCNDAYNNFIDLKIETINARTELTTVLELLHDKCFNVEISVKPGSDILNDDVIQNCMQNIVREHIFEETVQPMTSSALRPLLELKQAAEDHFGYELITDVKTGTFTEKVIEEHDNESVPDMRIIVLDNRDGKIVGNMTWTRTMSGEIVRVD